APSSWGRISGNIAMVRINSDTVVRPAIRARAYRPVGKILMPAALLTPGRPAQLQVMLRVFLMCASADGLISSSAPIGFNSARFQMDSHLLPKEKLAILQASDSRRKWHSLDDQRVCVLCDRTITGRQIEIV